MRFILMIITMCMTTLGASAQTIDDTDPLTQIYTLFEREPSESGISITELCGGTFSRTCFASTEVSMREGLSDILPDSTISPFVCYDDDLAFALVSDLHGVFGGSFNVLALRKDSTNSGCCDRTVASLSGTSVTAVFSKNLLRVMSKAYFYSKNSISNICPTGWVMGSLSSEHQRMIFQADNDARVELSASPVGGNSDTMEYAWRVSNSTTGEVISMGRWRDQNIMQTDNRRPE